MMCEADIISQADTRTKLTRPCFSCLSMTPQADMTSEAHMSPQAGIVILQYDVRSQADIVLQGGTRTRLARFCFFAYP